MKCLDHIDMAVMAGAVTVLASAIFFFAYLGIQRPPLVAPAPISAAAFLQEELGTAINEAIVTPVRVTSERARTEAVLGQAIRDLTLVKAIEASFIPELARTAAGQAQARREFLEARFKLPSDWRGTEFRAMERDAEARAQPVLGGMIVAGSQALLKKMEAAEPRYGQAVLAATLARQREAIEPAASQATLVAAARVLTDLAERAAPAPTPEMTRESSWGFGSIGDGAFIPFVVLAAGALLLLAAGAAMTQGESGAEARTVEAHCETTEKDVQVVFLISDKVPYEVTRCSAFNGGPVTCDKRCLTWTMAHAA